MSQVVNGKAQETIGLLFVHGIGEQKRFEHLREMAGQFAELMRQAESDTASDGSGEVFGCAVEDKTEDWTLPPGQPDSQGESPIRITLESSSRRLIFRCHEVWWADLGARTGLVDVVLFWIWAFGQWCAPIYRELDAAGLKKEDTTRSGAALNKKITQLATLPDSIVGRFRCELGARFKLLLAGLATSFVVVSWVIAKRLLAKLLRQAPTPTLLVSYVGDVRTYEERAAPGDTALSDPGYPRRVGIRRRMVTEMVAMGEMAARGEVDRWYVAAHSQGTVVAYNGLTEIGHTLPNYLPEAQWNGLPTDLKRDPGCVRRETDELQSMMPSRPAWLAIKDVVNRPKLFKQLKGVITYGSPLNKFAAIWPRIVATATDRNDGKNPFAEDCRWLNLRARQDPVSGDLSTFYGPPPPAKTDEQKRPGFSGCIPPLVNIETPVGPDILISHLRYFEGGESFSNSIALRQRRAVLRWVMDGGNAAANQILDRIPPAPKILGLVMWAYYAAFLAGLLFAAASLITLGGDLLSSLFGEPGKMVWIGPRLFAAKVWGNLPALVAVSSTAIAGGGYIRWISESRLNISLADKPELEAARRINRIHLCVAILLPALVAGAILWLRFAPFLWLGWGECPSLLVAGQWVRTLGWVNLWLMLSGALTTAGLIGHPLVNKCIFKPVHYI